MPIALTDDVAKLLDTAKITPAQIAHEECPEQQVKISYPTYRLHVSVIKQRPGGEAEVISTGSVDVEMPTFVEALPILANKLIPYWEQVQGSAALIDQDPVPLDRDSGAGD